MSLKQSIRKRINHFLRSRGYQFVPLHYHHLDYYENLDKVRYDWLKEYRFRSILDAGASDGGFAHRIRPYFPKARLYCFEPLDSSLKRLMHAFRDDPAFQAFPFALSDASGMADFHVHQSAGCSSLLSMTASHERAYPGSLVHVKEQVVVKRLDEVLDQIQPEPPILLKIDVQGAEKQVLMGAGEWIKNFKMIFLEVNFTDLYKDCPLFDEVFLYLHRQGFHLKGIENVSQSLLDGSFLQGDAFFLNGRDEWNVNGSD